MNFRFLKRYAGYSVWRVFRLKKTAQAVAGWGGLVQVL